MKNLSAASLILVVTISPLMAQSNYSCDTVLTRGLRNISISSDSSSNLNTVFSQYCYADGRSNASSFNAGLDAVVKSIPVKFTLGSNDNSTAMTNFCKTYSSSSDARGASNRYLESIVQRAYDSYDACVRISSAGYFVTHDIVTPDKAQILLRAGVGKPIEIKGLDATGNVTCNGPDGNGSEVKYGAATSVRSDNAINVFCTRTSRDGGDGLKYFDEAGVAIAINGDKYNFYWPQSNILPDKLASNIQTSITELRNNTAAIKDKIDNLGLSVYVQKFKVNPSSQAVGDISCPNPASGLSVSAISAGVYLDEPNERNASFLRHYTYPVEGIQNKWHYSMINAAGTGMGHPPGNFAAYVVCLTTR